MSVYLVSHGMPRFGRLSRQRYDAFVRKLASFENLVKRCQLAWEHWRRSLSPDAGECSGWLAIRGFSVALPVDHRCIFNCASSSDRHTSVSTHNSCCGSFAVCVSRDLYGTLLLDSVGGKRRSIRKNVRARWYDPNRYRTRDVPFHGRGFNQLGRFRGQQKVCPVNPIVDLRHLSVSPLPSLIRLPNRKERRGLPVPLDTVPNSMLISSPILADRCSHSFVRG